MTETKPRLVWDVREEGWFSPNRAQKTAWLEERGLPVDDIYRVEFYLLDAPSARVYCYHRDEQGHKHWNEHHTTGDHDHSACAPAYIPPYDVPLRDLPRPDLGT